MKAPSLSISPARLARFAAFLQRVLLITNKIVLAMLAVIATMFFPPTMAIVFCIVVWKSVGPKRHNGTSHGTARWAEIPDLLRAGCLFQQSGAFIGSAITDQRLAWSARLHALLRSSATESYKALSLYHAGTPKALPLILRTPQASPHMFVFGASGSGKSTCFAMQLLLQSTNSMVVMDPKGELARNTAAHRQKKLGHQIFVIDPFDISQCGFPSQSLNPLQCFREDELIIIDEARRLANALIVTKNENDPFWSQSAASVVTGIIAFLMSMCQKSASLNELRDITSSETLMQQALESMANSSACGGMLVRLANEISNLEGKILASVRSVINTNLSFLDSVPVSRVLGESTFDPDLIITGKATIYVCLPIDRLEEMAALQRVVLSTLINRLFSAGEDRARPPVEFLIDEAAALKEVDAVYRAIQFGRSYGIHIRALYQSTSQLERNFPGSQKHDVQATVAKIYAGSDDYETARNISDALGNQTVMSLTTQTGWNSGKSLSQSHQDHSYSSNHGSNDSISYGEGSRNLLTPSEILTLPRHLGIALLPGLHPILFDKIPYYLKPRGQSLRLLALIIWTTTLLALSFVMMLGGIWFFIEGQHLPEVEQALRNGRNLWQTGLRELGS